MKIILHFLTGIEKVLQSVTPKNNLRQSVVLPKCHFGKVVSWQSIVQPLYELNDFIKKSMIS